MTDAGAFEESHEFVVIGTGFGGAVAACRLAQMRLAPLVLERGRRYDPGDFPAMPAEGSLFPDLARWSFAQDRGLWDLVDLGPVRAAMAAGYGGGSLIYANVHMRAPHSVLDTWPENYRDGELGRHYDRVAAMLNVRPYPSLIPKREAFVSAATLLGRSGQVWDPAIAVTMDGGEGEPNAFHRPQSPCNDCGACCTGCNRGAKNTLDRNYLAVAEDCGADMRTQAEVVSIERSPEGGDRPLRIKYVDHLRGGISRTVRAAYVFVGAGAVHTTRLMLASGLGPRERVGTRYFGNADSIAMIYDTEQALHPCSGPTITTALLHSRSASPDHTADEWFMLQDGGYPAALHRAFGMMRSPLFLERNRYAETPFENETIPTLTSRPIRSSQPPMPRLERPASVVDAALVALDDRLLETIVPKVLRTSMADARARVEQTLETTIERTLEGLGSTLEQRLFEAKTAAHPKHPRWWRKLWSWIEAAGLRRLLDTYRKQAFVDASDDALLRYLTPAETASESARKLAQRALHLLGPGDGPEAKPDHRMMLLAMGRDTSSPRKMTLEDGKPRASEPDRIDVYTTEERLFRDFARSLGGELRVNPLWSYEQETVTVHSQGGCPMPFGDDPGFVDAYGAVRGEPGIILVDASVFPTPVGSNPSATIAAVAEQNVEHFLETLVKEKPEFEADLAAMKLAIDDVLSSYATRFPAYFGRAYDERAAALAPPSMPQGQDSPKVKSLPIGLEFQETMRGFVLPGDPPSGRPLAAYARAEKGGRERGFQLVLELHAKIDDIVAFTLDPVHRVSLTGEVRVVNAATGHPVATYEVQPGSLLELMPAKKRPGGGYVFEAERSSEPAPEPLGNLKATSPRTMRYRITAVDARGATLSVDGQKFLVDDPGFDAWEDTTALYTKVRGLGDANAYGIVRLSMEDFATKMLPSFVATGTEDPVRRAWAVSAFATFFFSHLQRTYLPGIAAIVREIGVR